MVFYALMEVYVNKHTFAIKNVSKSGRIGDDDLKYSSVSNTDSEIVFN